MLDVQHIFKTYEGELLLNDISFSIAEGETICLLGASGSGKSTLLRIIAGLEDPSSPQHRLILGTLGWSFKIMHFFHTSTSTPMSPSV
jgi:ABC-type nitrate/sulfonate/bicarbonate transport system ATPase subunit